MKKRSVLVGLLVLCMLILGGCGEKEKFDKAHAEVMQLMKQAVAVKAENVKVRTNKDFTYNAEDLQKQDEAITAAEQKNQEIMDQVNAKLKEMEEYAESDSSLALQLESIKTAVEQREKQWQQGIAERKSIANMLKQAVPAGPPSNPWKDVSKFKDQ